LNQFEKFSLLPGFISNILEVLLQEPKEETLIMYISQQVQKEKNYSSKIDISQLFNYLKKLLPKNLNDENILKMTKEMTRNQENEFFKDEESIKELEFSNEEWFEKNDDFLFASRMISGCLRNFVVIQLVNTEKKLVGQKIQEKEEILKFITMTIGIIHLIHFFNFELKLKMNQKETFKVFKNEKINEILLENLNKEISHTCEKIEIWKKNLNEHLKSFFKIYKLFNENVKKTIERNGLNIENLLKILFENLVKSKKKEIQQNIQHESFDEMMTRKKIISIDPLKKDQIEMETPLITQHMNEFQKGFDFEKSTEKFLQENLFLFEFRE
jgi:hypothetical protein